MYGPKRIKLFAEEKKNKHNENVTVIIMSLPIKQETQ